MFTLAHVSDWHTTPLDGAPPGALLNKRFFGWLSWKVKRRHVHRPEVLRALFEDLHAQAPEHVAVTGDLTNVALESEFSAAAELLRRLGSPERVSLVPGNHDAYVAVPVDRSWHHWSAYIRSDASAGRAGEPAELGGDAFPTVRVRGEVALVGVCSAVPTPLFHATGRVGADQCRRLEERLRALGAQGLCRVVLIHHPPLDAALSARRRLRDAAAFREVLARAGAELVLHGHRHRSFFGSLAGPTGPIPVVGVPSSSDVGSAEGKRAQYHLYGIERAGAEGWRMRVAVRSYDPPHGCFRADGERPLSG